MADHRVKEFLRASLRAIIPPDRKISPSLKSQLKS